MKLLSAKSTFHILVTWAVVTISYVVIVKEVDAVFASCVGLLGMLYGLHASAKLREFMKSMNEDLDLIIQRVNQIREKMGKK